VAVTVQRALRLVVDEEYRIVDVSAAAHPVLGHLLGQNVWEHFPRARSLFLPHYEEARGTGESVEFVQFYDGKLLRVSAIPRDRGLAVSWMVLRMVDVSTIETLRQSLRDIVADLAEEERNVSEARTRRQLRIVEGGLGAQLLALSLGAGL
jgi:hypothetical protein